MSSLNLGTGALGANPNPTDWRAIPLDEAEVTRLMGSASLMLDFNNNIYVTRPARDMSGGLQYPQLTDLATVTRAGVAYHNGWDFSEGGRLGQGYEVPANTPRIGPEGLLIEPVAVNFIRNPRGEGGTPGGALPTHWSIAAQGGASLTFQGRGEAGGRSYTEWLWTGTPTGDARIALETTTAVAAAINEGWTLGAGVQIVEGSMAGISSFNWRMFQRNSSATSLGGLFGPDFTPGFTPRGFRAPLTLSAPGTAFLDPRLDLTRGGASGNVHCRFRLYEPKLVKTLYAGSSGLPPEGSPGAFSRAADIINIPVGGWLGTGAITVMARFAHMRGSVANGRQNIWALDAGSVSNNNLSAHATAARALRFRAHAGAGSDQLNGVALGTAPTPGVVTTVAALAPGDGYFAASTGATQSVSSLDLSMLGAATVLRLGSDAAGRPLNGYLQELMIWPYRLTNAQARLLAGIDAPAPGAPLLEMI